jgi:hypothetical protein
MEGRKTGSIAAVSSRGRCLKYGEIRGIEERKCAIKCIEGISEGKLVQDS